MIDNNRAKLNLGIQSLTYAYTKSNLGLDKKKGFQPLKQHYIVLQERGDIRRGGLSHSGIKL